MDFSQSDTENQQAFRRRVCAWLEARLPTVKVLTASGPQDEHKALRGFQQALGAQGWVMPSCPSEWGGAGLSRHHDAIMREELAQHGLHALTTVPLRLLDALHDWGTHTQRRQWLPGIAQGRDSIAAMALEPGAPLDIMSLGIEAAREGDNFLLNGLAELTCVGDAPDLLWVLAVTGSPAVPHRDVGMFLLRNPWPGIAAAPADATSDPEGRFLVTFNDARVGSNRLIGSAHEGKAIAMATMLDDRDDVLPGGTTSMVTRLFEYARHANREGVPLSREPDLQSVLIEAYLDSHVGSLFRIRNEWMEQTGQDLTYRRAQHAAWTKRASVRLSEIIREVLGPYALLDSVDPGAPSHGAFLRFQHQSVAMQNPGGASEAQAGVVASHLGFESTRDDDRWEADHHREASMTPEREPVLTNMQAGG